MSDITIRSATEADLEIIEQLVDGFVAGHPAASHARLRHKLREAYFGSRPVAQLLLAERGGRVVGMGQWTLIYDMFWAAFGAEAGWLYVRPDSRGLGIPAAIAAEICHRARL